jgi:glutathione S-transferase
MTGDSSIPPRRRTPGRFGPFLAEKGIAIPLAPVDLAKGEQHSDAYRAINPRRVVPTLVLEDGTAIGEVPAI